MVDLEIEEKEEIEEKRDNREDLVGLEKEEIEEKEDAPHPNSYNMTYI
eukprot:SAG22_NODE_199_length_15450_cov_11.690704_2_plen_48_part_00